MSQFNTPGPQRDVPPPPSMPSGEDLADAGPPVWPKVVGIISIAWGSLGLLCGICGSIMLPFMPNITGVSADQLPPTMQFGPVQWVSLGVGVLLAVFLLVAGIMLVCRLPQARLAHIAWALLQCVNGVAATYLQWQAQSQMAQWAQANPNSPFAQGQSGSGSTFSLIFGIALTVFFAFAWPVFCLVWFVMVKRSANDITGDEPAAAV